HVKWSYNERWTPPLTIDEIAGLALEDGVESRLVITHTGEVDDYELLTTGIDESLLTSLPNTDWTLLVQDVDKHVPGIRSLYTALRFIPDWLIDDVMVSVAAPGGSVGPHTDSYDVFLLQGHGERSWQLGQAGKRKANSELRLLESAAWQQHYLCEPTDVLYVPPGQAHHGVAKTLCSTWSIGFQAPLIGDIAAMVGTTSDTAELDTRYRYPLTGRDTIPGEIPLTLMDVLPIDGDRVELLIAFGILISQCKVGLRPDWQSLNDETELHSYTRIAYSDVDADRHVFANGQHAAFDQAEAANVRRLCADRRWHGSLQSPVYRWLSGIGAFTAID
ncbi:MAG: cupin domain-containing protein, partial [Pseudomonadota bacterium]